ncbi:hypothetical protein bcgnr5378_06000 [Bacillus cereus]|uniref:Uncharacterized protein n=1 Tax=Bacillus cereus TaxID=1396 RepID=A0A161TPC0_BACCE|nr:hypothetical protein [Bacillus cereus]KZD55628.1 hypothetical protein B4088_5373 [Bacillus cereus]
MTNLTENTTNESAIVEEKKYWVVDVQNHEKFHEYTLDEAKEHLKNHFDEEDYEEEGEMEDHFERIDKADAEELGDLLHCISWMIFEAENEFLEYAEFEALKWDVEKVLKIEKYHSMLCVSGLIGNTLYFYAVKDDKKMYVKITFTEGEEAGKISIEDTPKTTDAVEDIPEDKEVWTFRKNVDMNCA